MRCPHCNHPDTQVKDSRPTDDNTAIRRRRQCVDCGARFTTFERVYLRDITVVKSNGRRELFDRDKIERSMRIALRKRPVEERKVEAAVNSIVPRIEQSGEAEVSAEQVGGLVMETLEALDPVAYVRFASVYRNFREAKDFEDFVGRLTGNER